MRRMLLRATLATGLLVGAAQPAVAGGALIETTAPLADRSEEAVKAAVVAAISKAVRGAVAMGFPWFQLREAQIAGDQVAIQILATDEAPGEATEPAMPDTEEDGEVTEDDEELDGPGPVPVSRIEI